MKRKPSKDGFSVAPDNGNVQVSSEDISNLLYESQEIVNKTNESYSLGTLKHKNKVGLKISERVKKASCLPNLWGANHRSLWPRINDTIDELIELDAHIGFHTEVWEVKGDSRQQNVSKVTIWRYSTSTKPPIPK